MFFLFQRIKGGGFKGGEKNGKIYTSFILFALFFCTFYNQGRQLPLVVLEDGGALQLQAVVKLVEAAEVGVMGAVVSVEVVQVEVAEEEEAKECSC